MTDSKKPNLNLINLGIETDADKITALVEQARRQFPARMGVFEMLAKERWAQFQAYQAEGFDALQSIRLIVADIQRPSAN